MTRNVDKTLSLGGGELFISYGDSGYRYFGQTKDLTMDVKANKLAHQNAEGNVLTTDLEITKDVEVSLKFSTDDINENALKLWLFGDVNATIVQGSADFVDVTVTASPGEVVTLGDAIISEIQSVTDANNQSVDLSYIEVKHGTGLVEISKDAPIPENSQLTFSVKFSATQIDDISAVTAPDREISMKFVGRPKVGSAKIVEFWRVKITPDGSFSLKDLEKFASLGFTGTVLEDTSKPEGKRFFDMKQVTPV